MRNEVIALLVAALRDTRAGYIHMISRRLRQKKNRTTSLGWSSIIIIDPLVWSPASETVEKPREHPEETVGGDPAALGGYAVARVDPPFH
jgi:hypothetical protein